jgi:hypothetical protein
MMGRRKRDPPGLLIRGTSAPPPRSRFSYFLRAALGACEILFLVKTSGNFGIAATNTLATLTQNQARSDAYHVSAIFCEPLSFG